MPDSREPSPASLVDALKALANPARMEIVQWLQDPDAAFVDYEPIANRCDVGACVSHIQAKSGLAQSTISSYMATLERADIVRSTRVGKWTHYRLNEDRLREISDALSP